MGGVGDYELANEYVSNLLRSILEKISPKKTISTIRETNKEEILAIEYVQNLVDKINDRQNT